MKFFSIQFCFIIATIVAIISVIKAQCPYRTAHANTESSCPYSKITYPASASIKSITQTLNRVFSVPAQPTPYSPIPDRIGSNELLKIMHRTKSPKSPKSPIPCAVAPVNCVNNSQTNPYRSFDGTCNNLQYPLYGAANTRITRALHPRYGDSVYTPTLAKSGNPLPNARLLSLSVYGDQTLPDQLRTYAALQFGQIMAHDMGELTTQGAPENCCANQQNKLCYPIILNPNDPSSSNENKQCLHMARAISDYDTSCPRSGLNYAEKLSVQTGFMDLSSLYGNSLSQSKKTRLFKDGLLKISWINNRPWVPVSQNIDGECGGEDNYHCFNMPDMRNQFVPLIAAMHTVFFREHNRIASICKKLNPNWGDEKLFQEARNIVIGQYQKIAYYDMLPLLLGPEYTYANKLAHYVQANEYVHDYNPNVNAAPLAEFTAVAFRYSHNSIPGFFSLVSGDRAYNTTLRLSNYFGRPESVNLLSEGDNFDSLLRCLTTQPQKLADSNIDREIKYYFNRKSYQEFGGDLKAMDIQRSREYGMASYNDMRELCGLPRAYDWSGFANEISAEKLAVLASNYETPDDVEASVAGSIESHAPGAHVGPTFRCILTQQFMKSRTGDRYFFEHEDHPRAFTREQLAEIRKASISALFCNNADNLNLVQRNAFLVPNDDNPLECCRNVPQIDLTKWKEG